MPVLESIIEFVAPAECLRCGQEGGVLCAECLPLSVITKRPTCYRCNKLTDRGQVCASCRPSSRLSGVTVASHYDGAVKELITALKYQHQRSAARLAARLIAPLLDPGDYDLVTAVPTSASRHRQRGYNQAALIGRALAKQLRLPYSETLGRVSNAHQVGTDRRRRLEQVKGIFRVKHDIAGLHILIIDDVLTTGATMAECAKELKTAGAKRVWGAVVAKH